ncbi:MAG: hypothetical protein AAFX94_13365 [Myxococcota bacterium]
MGAVKYQYPDDRSERGLASLDDLIEVARILWSHPRLSTLSHSALPFVGRGDEELLFALCEAGPAISELRERVEALTSAQHHALQVTPDLERFRAPGGGWESFGKRRTCQRVFAALIGQPRDGESSALGIEALFERCWGSTGIRQESKTNRVYVAINGLRRMGLKRILLNTDRGYFLDPRIPVLEVPG